MRSAGYNETDDAPLFERTRDLLLKRSLQRPPLPADTALLKGTRLAYPGSPHTS